MANQFDIDWPHGHQSRAGRPVRIICKDAAGKYPIIALERYGDSEYPMRYTNEGFFRRGGEESILDLVNIYPEEG